MPGCSWRPAGRLAWFHYRNGVAAVSNHAGATAAPAAARNTPAGRPFIHVCGVSGAGQSAPDCAR